MKHTAVLMIALLCSCRTAISTIENFDPGRQPQQIARMHAFFAKQQPINEGQPHTAERVAAADTR